MSGTDLIFRAARVDGHWTVKVYEMPWEEPSVVLESDSWDDLKPLLNALDTKLRLDKSRESED
mgnify:FL=1|jgi:hypothetical protein